MGALILAGLLVGSLICMGAVLFAAGLAWVACRLLPGVTENALALVTAGLLPTGALALVIASYSTVDCCVSGPEVQGLLVISVVLTGLVCVAWPVGYRVNRRVIGSTKQ